MARLLVLHICVLVQSLTPLGLLPAVRSATLLQAPMWLGAGEPWRLPVLRVSDCAPGPRASHAPIFGKNACSAASPKFIRKIMDLEVKFMISPWPDTYHGAMNASAGNRTRVTSMATMYSTTRPLMLWKDYWFCTYAVRCNR